jgi:hypothetical protein
MLQPNCRRYKLPTSAPTRPEHRRCSSASRPTSVPRPAVGDRPGSRPIAAWKRGTGPIRAKVAVVARCLPTVTFSQVHHSDSCRQTGSSEADEQRRSRRPPGQSPNPNSGSNRPSACPGACRTSALPLGTHRHPTGQAHEKSHPGLAGLALRIRFLGKGEGLRKCFVHVRSVVWPLVGLRSACPTLPSPGPIRRPTIPLGSSAPGSRPTAWPAGRPPGRSCRPPPAGTAAACGLACARRG